jgi:hypothetical protein
MDKRTLQAINPGMRNRSSGKSEVKFQPAKTKLEEDLNCFRDCLLTVHREVKYESSCCPPIWRS